MSGHAKEKAQHRKGKGIAVVHIGAKQIDIGVIVGQKKGEVLVRRRKTRTGGRTDGVDQG